MKIDIGLSDAQRNEIAGGLARLLADTYTLYLKTHNFHWNVTGPHFNSLHLLFETQYNELWLATDLLAERIRALGVFAPGSYVEFSKLTSIKEDTSHPAWDKMVAQLVEGHEAVTRTAREVLSIAADADDEVTVNVLSERMDAHEKAAWMLRSLIS